MKSVSISWKNILILTGALCAYLIGAATATGQEALQFYASHGFFGIGSVVITLILFAWSASSLIAFGYDTKNLEQNVYKYYFGNIIGTLFEWIVVFFLFGLVITLISGAGAIFTEYYEVNRYFGAALMSIMIFLTVLLSLKKLVELLGIIGPIIIIFTVIISVISIVTNIDSVMNANESLQSLEVPKAVDSWWFSGMLYAAFGIIVSAPFLVRMGSTTKNRREALLGGTVGSIVYALTTIVITVALLTNISFIFAKETPLVFLAKHIHPVFGVIFSIIILAGIYTTAAPMFWYVCDRIFTEGSNKHKVLAISLTVFSFFGGLFLPFGTLVGTVYPFMGILGIVLFVAIAVKQIFNITISKTDINNRTV